jgi:two-component system cell cycle sensor histidine kinase/response regulator CckA
VNDSPDTAVSRIEELDSSIPELWRSSFQRAPDAQWICRSDGALVESNQTARKLFDGDSTIKVTELLPTRDPRLASWFNAEARRPRSLLLAAAHVKSRAGATITADISIHRLTADHCLVCLRDVSDRHRLEAHMRRVMAALECSADAVFMTDANFRINFVNPAFHKITGYTIEDVLGQTADFFRADSEAAKIAECRAALESGKDWTSELVNLHADGSFYPVAVSATPVRERNGDLIGYASFERDITEQRKMREQLFQSQKMETVGTLAAGVAHDFNNLLQVIRGNTKLVLGTADLSEPVRQKLRQVSDAAGRAADITRQLLSFSRASDNKREVIDLNQLIEDAGQMSSHKLERAIDIDVQPAELPLYVDMNPTHAHQMLMNLCVNALYAMGNSGRLLLWAGLTELTETQATEVGAEAGASFAHCKVADTGGGIPPELLRKIFDPFFTTKPPGKGTGLGLSIVHKAIKEAGGLLEVDSRHGEGTTFNMYLPLADGLPPEPDGNIELCEEQGLPELEMGSGHILLVDDEEYVLDFTQDCLEAAGYEVTPAASPDEAMAALEKMAAPPDLLFTDYNMGKVTGLQLIARVAEAYPSVRFVLASGYLEDSERLLIEQYDTSILQKPFELQEATQAVAAQIRKGGELDNAG